MDRAILKSHQIHYFLFMYIWPRKKKVQLCPAAPLVWKHTHSFALLLRSMWPRSRQERWGGGQAELLWKNLKLHIHQSHPSRSHFTNRFLEGSAEISQTLLPDWLAWVRTVCEKKLWLQSKVASVLVCEEDQPLTHHKQFVDPMSFKQLIKIHCLIFKEESVPGFFFSWKIV